MKFKNIFIKRRIILALLIVIAFAVRVYGLNWDQGQHLHPDERFLTMVGTAMKMPESLTDYLNPAVSTFNPYNIGYSFFVYGTFPLTLTKIAAILFGFDDYNNFTLLGRLLSAVFDTGTLIFTYKIVGLWEKKYKWDKKIKYLAAFFYAISVLSIQHSHFFVVDIFLTFFILGSVYFSINFFYKKGFRNFVAAAILFGLALGSKINAVVILPLIMFYLFVSFIRRKQIKRLLIYLPIFVFLAYITLRFADPKFFNSGSLFDPSIGKNFISNIEQLQSLAGPNALYFPPAVQWFNKKPFLFSTVNIAFFGLGIPYFILALLGLFLLVRKKKIEIIVLITWLACFYLYQSTRFSPSMRYFIFLYPFFAIAAAAAMANFFNIKIKLKRYLALFIIFALVLIWPLSFLSIYSRLHSRVTASYWIHENIPENSYFAEEHWDDWLPVNLPDFNNRTYRGEAMPVFGEDNTDKWQQMNKILSQADYIIFTSNRGYGSIMPQPKMYPKMSKFYQDLFAGRLNFVKIKEFTSYPELCFMFHVQCFMIPDQWSEEAFTVYDHPKVIIFKRE